MHKFSFFQPPISNTIPSETIDLPELYKRITSPAYQKQTEILRGLDDPKEAKLYKAKNFPYVTFAGCFEKRSDKQLLQPSGLMVIDLDNLPEVEPIREALIANKEIETELLFVSPSGRGLKWVTSYPHETMGHQECFQQLCSYLQAYYDLKADSSGKDVSRACFLTFDPQPFINPKHLL